MVGKKASCSPDSPLPSPGGTRQAPLSQWGKGRPSEWEGCQQYCVSLKALYHSLTSEGQAVYLSLSIGVQGSREVRDTQDHTGSKPELTLGKG